MTPIYSYRRVVWAAVCLLVSSQAGCRAGGESSPPAKATATPAAPRDTGPVPASPADDGEWRIPAKDYASTRFSGLDQITTGNVARLQPEFSFSTGVLRGHEAVPIVANRTMYVVTPHPNILFALA